jgi:alpha-beta hydrolase superfamily lysophospholipase
MNAPPTPRSVYLETAGTPPMFAVFHPAAAAPKHRAVLLCPPFGWEDMCSYRSRRDWAERLAGAGHPTLRIDLPGSGDSAGAPTDPGQLDTWTRAVSAAARWLGQTSGASPITALGIGLGGMLACRAAVDGAPIDELVLWHVPSRGRTLVRELRAFSALEVAYIPDPDETGPRHEPEPLEEGALVANGYLMSAETVAALERLDLADAAHSRGLRRVLLLGCDGLKVDERLRGALERGGAGVAVADGPGYAAMIAAPDARPPTAVFELVDSWLADGGSEDGSAGPRAPQADGGAAPEEERRPNPRPDSVSVRAEMRLVHAGVELVERPIAVRGSDTPLFGILTEPVGEHVGLCAVLMNAGPQRRTGPNRMWVEIARRWAARGVPTLRFDLAGIGDSDGDAAALVHVASLYAPEYVGQARAALDTLAADGLPERFIVLGLCSGAYWSTHTALGDERIGTVVMLNPRSLVWDEWVYGLRRTRELRERLLWASTWRKLLRGEITFARHLETARALAGRATIAPRRLRERVRARRGEDGGYAVEAIFDALRDRGQRTFLLFTGSEPLHREFTVKGVLERLERWPNLDLSILGTSADTHTLTPLWLQRQVHELVDRALQQELARLPERARARALGVDPHG